jgi:hypothetical protein
MKPLLPLHRNEQRFHQPMGTERVEIVCAVSRGQLKHTYPSYTGTITVSIFLSLPMMNRHPSLAYLRVLLAEFPSLAATRLFQAVCDSNGFLFLSFSLSLSVSSSLFLSSCPSLTLSFYFSLSILLFCPSLYYFSTTGTASAGQQQSWTTIGPQDHCCRAVAFMPL